MRSFEVSRFLLIGLLVTVGLLVIYAAVMTFGFYRADSMNDALQERVAAAEAELVTAEADRDAAQVRLMLLGKEQPEPAEPTIKTEEKTAQIPVRKKSQVVAVKTPAPKPPPANAEKREEREAASTAREAVPSSEKTDPDPASTRESEVEEPEETVLQKVRVENFEIWPVNDKTAVRFKFRLENASPVDVTIKGYTFVALEPGEGGDEPVRIAPWSPLKDGEPSLVKRGQYFGISRFKFVRGTLPDIMDVTRFERATVYVYSETGILLHKQVWQVDDALRS